MGLISGRKGDALFSEPLMRYFRHNPLPELLKKTEGLNDDRLLALVTALVVEDRLDAALKAFLPRYGRLADSSSFTFSTKVALLESMSFVPPQICTASDLIRQVRNEFAHNLEIASFDQLKGKLKQGVCNLRSSVYGVFGPEEKRARATFLEEFKALTFFCLVGLDGYCENLAYLRNHIQSDAFVETLSKSSDSENESELKRVMSAKPISVEYRDGQRIEQYDRGLVNITIGALEEPPA